MQPQIRQLQCESKANNVEYTSSPNKFSNMLSLHRQFNFVGKLLGPKGNSMKRLQEETLTKMAVLGKGSMRDKQKVTFNLPSLLLENKRFSFFVGFPTLI